MGRDDETRRRPPRCSLSSRRRPPADHPTSLYEKMIISSGPISVEGAVPGASTPLNARLPLHEKNGLWRNRHLHLSAPFCSGSHG